MAKPTDIDRLLSEAHDLACRALYRVGKVQRRVQSRPASVNGPCLDHLVNAYEGLKAAVVNLDGNFKPVRE